MKSLEIVKFNNVTKIYRSRKGLIGEVRVKALDGISFEVKRGEKVAIVGESGSGKSTILKIISGIEDITSGYVEIDGTVLEAGKRGLPKELKGKIQIVFQDPFSSLNPRMRVFEIITEPVEATAKRLSKDEKIDIAKNLLELVGLPPTYAFRYPHQTSGGERQRIAIARAIATEPKIMLLDEPTSNLDVFTQAHVINILIDIFEKYMITSIFVTHNIALALKVADRIIIMKDGKIVEDEKAEDILKIPKSEYTRRLIECGIAFHDHLH